MKRTLSKNPPMKTSGCLSTARCGELLRIAGLREGCTSERRLRELGFCESAEVCKIADGGVCLCLLQGARVAIGAELAGSVLVERVA